MSEPEWHLCGRLTLDAQEALRWDALLAKQDEPTPFMRHAYLNALHVSGSATPETGWQPVWLWVKKQGQTDWQAGCVVYIKAHSYGEYVFDFSWADAYARNGLAYYPKAVIASPFTPVPGTRLLAESGEARDALLSGVLQWCEAQQLSSLHLLFASAADMASARRLGLLERETVQFHWRNPQNVDWAKEVAESPLPAMTWAEFLSCLQRDKRKKIQQEQRRVKDAGVHYRVLEGQAITASDWDFFYQCYAQTYWEHGNAPYLTRDFFHAMAQDMPDAWLMFVAHRGALPIACSLLGVHRDARGNPCGVYGRYWGALQRVDALHFDACYYQPLQWCLQHGVRWFEGGAQGEHKMARGLLPQRTHSAHWLRHPAFAQAVEVAVEQETQHLQAHWRNLQLRSPFKFGQH